MNELTVKTNEFKLPTITWNKNEVSTTVDEVVSKYQGLEFDESQLDVAKKDLASLRKIKKNLNQQKIDVKKQWNVNYTSFENDIKAEMAKIDNVVNDIDNQVKEYTEKQKQARAQVIKFYAEWCDIEKYTEFQNEWLLKKWESKEDEKLRELFVSIKDEHDRGVKIIKQTCASHNLKADMYLDRFNTDTLDNVVELIIDTAANNEVQATEPVEIDTTSQVLTTRWELKGTKSQLIALKDYAEKIGVDWRKV